MMKKYHFALMASLLLVSCNEGANRKSVDQQTDSIEVEALVDAGKIVKEKVAVTGEFIQITNMCGINIVYSQGDYDIELEGPAQLLKMIKTDFDSGVLTFSSILDGEGNVNQFRQTADDITAYVSSPELNIMAVCDRGSFRSEGTIRTSHLHIGSINSGTIDIDSIVCSEWFKYEYTGSGHTTLRNIECADEASLILTGTGTSDINLTHAAKLIVTTDNKGTSTISGQADNTDLISFGSSSTDLSVNTNHLDINAQGESTVVFSGKAQTRNTRQGKKAQLTIK